MTTPRYSLFATIHKAVRLLVTDLVVAAGQTDLESPTELRALRDRIGHTVRMLESHAHHEDVFIMPLVRIHGRATFDALDAEHAEQEEQLARLVKDCDTLVAACGVERATLGRALVTAIARLAGELFVHMADEEEQAMAVLWPVMTDAELAELEHQLVQTIGPEEMGVWVELALRSNTPEERFGMLSGIRASAPPSVFAGVCQMARAVLPAPAWHRLDADLSVAVAHVPETSLLSVYR